MFMTFCDFSADPLVSHFEKDDDRGPNLAKIEHPGFRVRVKPIPFIEEIYLC